MGYRTYIGFMPKKEYNKIKSMTEEQWIAHYHLKPESELDEGHVYKGVYDYGKVLFEFGKYTDFDPPKGSFLPFFKKKEMKDRYDGYDFYVVAAPFLAYIIETYRLRIAKYYKEMTDPFDRQNELIKSVTKEYRGNLQDDYDFDFSKATQEDKNALYKIIEHVKSFASEWLQLTPFYLDKGDEITDSWKFEYTIFELIRIYKSFDWNNNVMIYYGY